MHNRNVVRNYYEMQGESMNDSNMDETYIEKMAKLLMIEGDIETANALNNQAKNRERESSVLDKHGVQKLRRKAKVAFEYGDFESAAVFYQELYKIASSHSGPEHVSTLEFLLRFAQCLRHERLLESALSYFSLANRIALTNLDKSHFLTKQASQGVNACKDAIQQARGFKILANKFNVLKGKDHVIDEVMTVKRIHRAKDVATKLAIRKKTKWALLFFRACFDACIEQYRLGDLNEIAELMEYAKCLHQFADCEEVFESYRKLVRVTTKRRSDSADAGDLKAVLREFAVHLNEHGQHKSAKATIEILGSIEDVPLD